MTRPTIIIDSQQALLSALDQWRREPALGVDTEGNSFFAYRERTCLVQISSRDADWIVDPFAVDLAPLGPLMVDPAIEKVFHASEYDILSLKRDHGFKFANLYDTLIAAKAVGHRRVGLANLLEELLGLKLAKDEQRSDWGRRPLSPEQIEYAFADTRHLLELADKLREKVAAAGEIVAAEVAIDCERMTEREPRPREIDPDAFERHKLARKMDPVSRQILKALYEAREDRARALDKPVFRIVSDDALAEIAVRRPQSRAELSKIVGVTPPVINRHGDALLDAVRAGLERGPLPFQRRPANLPDVAQEERFEALRAWRKAVADARGVEVEVIANNSALKILAKANPSTQEQLVASGALDRLRVQRYGSAILETLQGKRAK